MVGPAPVRMGSALDLPGGRHQEAAELDPVLARAADVPPHVSRPSPPPSPFDQLDLCGLTLVLSLPTRYLEAHPTIFSDVTFIFTEVAVAAQFLSLRRWHGMAFQSIEICARMPHPSPELYRPDKDRSGPLAGRPDRSRLSSKSNAWERLCSVLAGMGEIRELRIWLDRHGLPNWHVNLSEWRFCDRLRDVRAKVFVLGLPDVPEDREEAACDYLEGAILDELPFVVERAPRIDNWRANLESMVGFG